MMNVIKIFLVFLIGCSMSAQEEDFFGNKMIQLSDKLFICDEKIYKETPEGEDDCTWRLYLKREGEKDIKLLEEIKTVARFGDTLIEIPNMIASYQKGKYIYVFLYKDRRAMLDIYYFSDGVNFERTGYSLHRMGGASVMNFGLYVYSIDIQEIENSHYISYIAARALVDRGSKGILRIKDGDVSKIEVKEDSEKTIFYPYRIKEVEGKEVSRKEKEKIFHQELMKQLEEKNLLVRKDFLETYGYINEQMNHRIYYIFYKTSNTEKTMKLAKYGRYFINSRANFYLMFADYIEQPLLPEYSRWNPKKQ